MDRFNELVKRRWLSAQPVDIQDYLEKYAEVRLGVCQSGRGEFQTQIQVSFANSDYANVLRCQTSRLVQPDGLPELAVSFGQPAVA
ncbi:MAG: hypothetical protein DCF32_15050 [Leptolyngbya sp.]|nr:MAG: hypothetical protein DCF32_15050 [Leptolyngbya sp.]